MRRDREAVSVRGGLFENQIRTAVIARSEATLTVIASEAKQSSLRHSGAMRSIEPGISRFPDAQLRI
jgi:hypothetical protein